MIASKLNVRVRPCIGTVLLQVNVATTLVNLSSVYESMSNVSEARKCMEEAMRIRTLTFGVNNPEVAKTMASPSSAYKLSRLRPL